MKILLATMFIGLAVFPNSVELSPMQMYAGTSGEQQHEQLQAAAVATLPFLFYFDGREYRGITQPANENLRVEGGYYVGKNVEGGTIPLHGPGPHHETCIQRVYPFSSDGLKMKSRKWLQRKFNVRQP